MAGVDSKYDVIIVKDTDEAIDVSYQWCNCFFFYFFSILWELHGRASSWKCHN